MYCNAHLIIVRAKMVALYTIVTFYCAVNKQYLKYCKIPFTRIYNTFNGNIKIKAEMFNSINVYKAIS